MSDSPSRMTIVVVGGVAGGASAATRARRMNENADIIVFEKGQYVSFANCGLPYYLGGEISDRSKLLVATVRLLEQRFRLDVRIRQEVIAIDRANKTVRVQNHGNGQTYEQGYDKLILALGAVPIVPPLEGIDAPNVFALRDIPDTDAIQAAMRDLEKKQAVVVGAGYIGLEMVEQLTRVGFEVSLVELRAQVLPQIDPEMAHRLEEELIRHGVKLHLGVGLERVITDSNGVATAVELTDGTRIETSMVILGIGVRPNNTLAQQAGLELGDDGGIKTNPYMQTSDPDIYAVGDAAQYTFGATGEKMRVPLAGPANRAGRLAGEHAATGHSRPMGDVLGTAIVRAFDVTVAMTGLTLNQAARLNRKVASVTVVAGHHAGYYPGAKTLFLKLIFDPEDGRVLGAQAVGESGIDKRIDVIATAIAMRASVGDLAQLDLAYAPPFGSAKDPVHMAAFTACNQMDGITQFLDADADLSAMQIVDVRTPHELVVLPVAAADGAVNIPVDTLRSELERLDPAMPTAVICRSGVRAYAAARIFMQHGFQEVYVVAGGASVRNHAIAAQTTAENLSRAAPSGKAATTPAPNQ